MWRSTVSPRVAASKRDEYLQERREIILDAALEVLGRKGFAAASMSEIADAAEIAKGTVYLYFSSKEALLHAVLDERSFVPQLEHLTQDTGAPIALTLTTIAEHYLRYMKDWLPIMRLVLTDTHLSSTHLERIYGDVIGKATATLARLLEAQAAAGHLRPLDDAYLTARAFWGMLVVHVVTQELLGGKAAAPVAPDVWVRQVVGIFLDGLRT
jgi:AcrR family transcriptional regulator